MKTYDKRHTKEISFPLGGIGTGCIGLGGNGRLQDWEIFNRPAKGSLNGYSHFAVRAIRQSGAVDARVLCGDTEKDLSGQYCKGMYTGFGYGVAAETMAGFPHFREWRFHARFPFATVTLWDADFPARVRLTAHNPFIPMDEDASSIPAAYFEVEIENTAHEVITFSTACSVCRPFHGENTAAEIGGYPAVFMQSNADPATPAYRDMTLCCLTPGAVVQPCWYRGGWQDPIATFFREFSEGRTLPARTYDTPADRDTATLDVPLTLAPGEKKSVRFLLAWNVPNRINDWSPIKDAEGHDLTWKNYYAVLWADSRASCRYAAENWDTHAARSCAFADAVLSSTMDKTVLEAALCNLTTLKSPTVLRLADGSLWGWEGVFEEVGSCEGTCMHVWNYAYALPFLFPHLERSIRENEFRYNICPDGLMTFRMTLPPGARPINRWPCVDGQMGAVIKTYREWKLSGDDAWLASLWPQVKLALSYAWKQEQTPEWSWDSDRDGILEGRQHHTLDTELFGPSAWLQGFYIAALRAAERMAERMGDAPFAAECRRLAENGSRFTETELFNGEYYIQKIDLTDRSLVARFGKEDAYWSEEFGQLKYQIGEGCEIDQMVAEWHAHLCGLGDIFDPDHRAAALRALVRYNYKPSLRHFANPWRVYALQDEGGTVMCEYPAGREKPAIPLSYCEECMSGFEYALAGLLCAKGMEQEGLTIVKSVRDRNNGKKRNPFNEIECGSNYARAMAAWALIPILSGFSFDMTEGRIGFCPVGGRRRFRSFFSVGRAWGDVTLTDRRFTLTVMEGELPLSVLTLPHAAGAKSVTVDGARVAFAVEDGALRLATPVAVQRQLIIKFA